MTQVRKPHEIRAAYWRFVADWDRFGDETNETEYTKYLRRLDKFGRELRQSMQMHRAAA